MFEIDREFAIVPPAKSTGWKAPSNGKARKPAPARVPLFLRLLALLGF